MSASSDTWMPWYIGDFLAATLHMNADEDGAYRRLIDALWMAGGVLQEVNDTFAIITKLGQDRWLNSRPIVAAKFQITGKEWRHRRVTEEIEKARNFRKRASAGGRGKAAKTLLNGHVTDAKTLLNGCSNDAKRLDRAGEGEGEGSKRLPRRSFSLSREEEDF